LVIWHAFLTLLSGFAIITAIAAAVRLLLLRAVPAWQADAAQSSPPYLCAMAGVAFAAAGCGGFVAAWLGADNPLGHITALSIAVLAVTALSAMFEQGRRPIAFSLLQVAVTPLGVVAGGVLRLKLWGWF
jgi:hypothetical protein